MNRQEQRYDDLHNEGAEGYNPHRTKDDGEPEWSRIQEQMARVERIMTGTSTNDPRYAQLEAEYAALEARYQEVAI